jgi:UDP-N-acetylglucosamine 4,6-dehydratase/UDP-glucose 4-epimerase
MEHRTKMIKRNKRYLVTGGYGFLAKKLITKLLDAKCKVTTICRNAYKAEELFSLFEGKVEVIAGDLLAKDTYDKLEGGTFEVPIRPPAYLEGGDSVTTETVSREFAGIFHLAAIANVGLCEDSPLECVKSNVIASINVLDYSVKADVDFCVGASTFAADKATGSYGASKLLMEKLFSEFSGRNPNCTYSIVRFGPLLYSPGSVLCKWKDALEENEEILLTAPDATRKFISPDDVVNNMVNVEAGLKELSVQSTRLQDLLDAFVKKYGNEDTKFKVTGLRDGEQLESGNSSDLKTVDDIIEMI